VVSTGSKGGTSGGNKGGKSEPKIFVGAETSSWPQTKLPNWGEKFHC